MAKKPAKKTRGKAHGIALEGGYKTRARLFYQLVAAARLDELIREVDSLSLSGEQWPLEDLGISAPALNRIVKLGIAPHQVFAHPNILCQRPKLIRYYRNLAAISKKGIQQVLFATDQFEMGRQEKLDRDVSSRLAVLLNSFMSQVITGVEAFTLCTARHALIAEMGAEVQGTWNNYVGQKAAERVKGLLLDYVRENRLGRPRGGKEILLNSGWRISFGSEPDVSFYDQEGRLQIAVEIKGSLDPAGAQSRYGEAKKSFQKALRQNPRCQTVYLASVFTEAVVEQVKTNGTVRESFNLTEVLIDQDARKRFLRTVFHHASRPT